MLEKLRQTGGNSYKSQFDKPDGLSGLAGYTQSTEYDAFGRVIDLTVGATASVYDDIVNNYDDNTGNLTSRTIAHTDGGTTAIQDEQDYHYDQAGNVTRQSSTRNADPNSSETQCYAYDGLDQLTAAWTASDQCTATPTSTDSSTVADKLGASSASWTTWTIDELGDRKSQTQHGFAGGPATDTTTAYEYGTSSGAQPHTLTSTSSTGDDTASTTYAYDTAGNMTSRNAGQGTQTLGYDDTGKLISATGSTGGDTSYEYDANGNLLIQKDPGTTSLYAGNQQFTLNTSTGAVSGARYYTLPDGSQVIRTGSTTTAFTYAVADQHGSPSLYLDQTTATPTWRQYTPYGSPRGTTPTGPDNHGFLNKPMDTTTGITMVGARAYDPDTGRFITDDPVLEQDDPNQLNGYGYAGNNPVVRADPTGERTDPNAPARNTWVGIPSAGKQVAHNNGLDKPSKSRSNHCNSDTTCDHHSGNDREYISTVVHKGDPVTTYKKIAKDRRWQIVTTTTYITTCATNLDNWDTSCWENATADVRMIEERYVYPACGKFNDDPKCDKRFWSSSDFYVGTVALCVSGTISVGKHVWGGEGCVAGDSDGETGVTFSTIDGKSSNVGGGLSVTFQRSNAPNLKAMCGNFSYIGGSAASYTASGFSGGGVQGFGLGRSVVGTEALPVTLEGGTSDTRLVWVPGKGGNQCHR